MKILGISAKKQGGKNSSANHLNGVILKKNRIISDFNLLESGELNVLTEFEDGSQDWGLLDLYRRDAAFLNAAEERIFPYVKNYSFADSLKEAAVNLFGLKPESVWGTDAQKMEKTHLLWENMPGVITQKAVDFAWSCTHGYPEEKYQVDMIVGRLGQYYEKWNGIIYHEPGPMTGREFLQFFGTEIGRKMYPPIWVNATINKIMAEQSGLAIVTDVRFPDEVSAIQKAGGYVVRLDREMFPEDKHLSEISLDPDVYGWNDFDAVIHNQDLSLTDACKLVEKFARSHNLV